MEELTKSMLVEPRGDEDVDFQDRPERSLVAASWRVL
jgi:hypothetical protein